MTATDVHLTTGWEPDLAPGDTLTRRYLFHWAALCEAFATAGGGRTVRTPEVVVSDSPSPAAYFDSATLLRPLVGRDGEAVLDLVESTTADGRGTLHLWSLWPTPDLRDRGWHLEGHPPLLARPPGPPPAPTSDVHLDEVGDAAALARWERTAIEGYPFPDADPDAVGSVAAPGLLDDPRLRLWTGSVDGRPASISALFAEDDLASLALGVTRPEARARGHWRAHAARRLAEVPDRWVAGVFSDMSRPLAERIGFVPLTRFTLWTLPRP